MESILSVTIGDIGVWQLEKATLIGLSSFPFVFHMMSYPLLSQDKEFKCIVNTEDVTLSDQCDESCTAWTFEDSGGLSLQEDFGLICAKEYLLSLRQTVFFLGMLVGGLVTGNMSDQLGRKSIMLALMFIWSASAMAHLLVHTDNFKLFLVLQFVLVRIYFVFFKLSIQYCM